MNKKLNSWERKALDKMSFDPNRFYVGRELGGVGVKSLKRLAAIGLIEGGVPERHPGQVGWRLTPSAWICMFGKSYDELTAPNTGPHEPLAVWKWPPD